MGSHHWRRKRPCAPSRVGRDESPLVASTCYVFNVAWEFHVFSCVLSARFVHNVMLPFAVPWIT
jgi:hypothetical protein